MKQKIRLPIEIWYIILDNYQYLIKINFIDPYKIYNQKKQQPTIYGSGYWKLKFTNKHSYNDIKNIALVNLAFYRYCFLNIYNIKIINIIDSKIYLKKSNILVSLKDIFEDNHYNFCDDFSEKKKITSQQYQNVMVLHKEYQIGDIYIKKIENFLNKVIRKYIFVIPKQVYNSIISNNNKDLKRKRDDDEDYNKKIRRICEDYNKSNNINNGNLKRKRDYKFSVWTSNLNRRHQIMMKRKRDDNNNNNDNNKKIRR